LILTSVVSTHAQVNEKQGIFRDSLDHAFDLSDFIIHAYGFVPIPFAITEPALGGLGGGLAVIFIKRHEEVIDSGRSKVKIRRAAPDITGVGGMYTANDSWGFLAFRSATLVKARVKYKALGGYANVNLDFYRDNDQGEEKKYGMNLKTYPAFLSLQRKFRHSSWSAGLEYLFLRTQAQLQSGDLASFLEEDKFNSDVSRPGVVLEVDNRDNVFTPDKGVKLHASLGWSDSVVGSDYDYLDLKTFLHCYVPLADNFVAGGRIDIKQVFDDPPFYLAPFIALRGVPTARYQGNISAVAEAEMRWDFLLRWSAVFFGGGGKAIEEWKGFSDDQWIASGGTGFRYLVARKFKLRMGVDVARGPEQWAYYIILGSAWFK
jgi:hypothetical protein